MVAVSETKVYVQAVLKFTHNATGYNINKLVKNSVDTQRKITRKKIIKTKMKWDFLKGIKVNFWQKAVIPCNVSILCENLFTNSCSGHPSVSGIKLCNFLSDYSGDPILIGWRFNIVSAFNHFAVKTKASTLCREYCMAIYNEIGYVYSIESLFWLLSLSRVNNAIF